MKDTKVTIRFFSIPQWKKEEKYLRKENNNGWEFVSVNGLCLYHFQKCEPKDVIYQLDYNNDSISQKNEYIQLFSDCGWEYIQNYVGYSYFRKPASEMDGTEEEIFCDDASRLDMMKRVFIGRIVPLLNIFFLIIIPQIIIQSQINRALMVLFCILLGVYLVLFIMFAVPYMRYYKFVHKK